jgi:hypothetical protein
MEKLLFGVGIFGEPGYTRKHKSYMVWYNMLARCYSEKEQKRCAATYFDCLVVNEWHNFQTFSEWYYKNYVDGWHLDKDILIKGNKIYGPDTCCFVPKEINNLFTSGKKIRGEFPVGINKRDGKFCVNISKFAKRYYLGTFHTIDIAFGIYKQSKEIYIKQVADIWKDKLPPKTHEALYNYQVEITD